jgi:hypothetical protein
MDLLATDQRTGAVECLGQTSPNDDTRREHFLKLPLGAAGVRSVACSNNRCRERGDH